MTSTWLQLLFHSTSNLGWQLRIGKELAEEILSGKYEYVLTTHIDKA